MKNLFYIFILTCSLFADGLNDFKYHLSKLLTTKTEVSSLFYLKNYNDIVKKFKNKKIEYTNVNLFVQLLENREFQRFATASDKLKLLDAMKQNGIEANYVIYNLYTYLDSGYNWTNPNKELKEEIQKLKYLIKHVDKFHKLVVDYSHNLFYMQPDIYSIVLVNSFQHQHVDKKLLSQYSILMKLFRKKISKYIKDYEVYSLVKFLSDKSVIKVDKDFTNKIKKIYKKKLSVDQEVRVPVFIDNYKLGTYITIVVKIDIKETENLMKFLSNSTGMNSDFSKEFNKQMTKEEIIKKVFVKYNFKNYKIVKTTIMVEHKRY